MEAIWIVGLVTLWGVVLVNLLLTLRVISWLRGIEDLRNREAEMEELPELAVDEPAPEFRTKTLSGELVRLADYTGRAVAFIFVSPRCGPCRQKMPMLVELSASAKERAGVELVLVSDQGTAETHAWIGEMREEDGVEVNLPVLVAPRNTSEFLMSYDPRGLTPYFCFVNEQGIVKARGPLGADEWSRLKQPWERQPAPRIFSRSPSKYR